MYWFVIFFLAVVFCSQGETKMVVTGNMPSGPAYGYSMKFGDTVVHAYEVQAGVLRCFCPGKLCCCLGRRAHVPL